MHIVIDTREQTPWHFPREAAKVSRGTLSTGDYAVMVEGPDGERLDGGFAIERKSLDDFVGTISTGWARFEREIQRMKLARFPNCVIIVEADWSDIIDHDYNHPNIPPAFILKRVAELTISGCAVLFCSDPTSAAGLAWRILLERKVQVESATIHC